MNGPGRRRMPDFAEVALVDILANGVAMLIIVIVLSIATRVEREQRFAEQAAEVATVMSHKLSTSLVLNSLAASPPARLHDYETSPLDQVYDPEVLPVLELHRGFVRELYSGAIWTRGALLAEESGLSAWVSGFNELQRQRIRVDVYDVDQFYVAMAIFREHGITVRHWHFVPEGPSLAVAMGCPPGMAAKDCADGVVAAAPEEWPDPGMESSARSGLGGPDWPPPGLALDEERGRGGPGALPSGVVPGMAGLADRGFARAGAGGGDGDGELSGRRGAERGRSFGSGQGPGAAGQAAGLGSFPNARDGRGGRRPAGAGAGEGRESRPDGPRGGGDGDGDGTRMRFRIALPESVRRELDGGGAPLANEPSLEAMLGVLLHYLGELQGTLDAGGSPSRQIGGFARWFRRALRDPPPIAEESRRTARDLAEDFLLMYRLGGPAPRLDPLAIQPIARGPGEDTVLRVETNRLIHVVGVGRRGPGGEGEDGAGGSTGRGGNDRGRGGGGELPGAGRPALDLNAYPGIWRGLSVTIEPDAVLLMPPAPTGSERLRWRAVAYVAPTLDDFIIGFVFAGVDAEGRLRVQADTNRVRVDGRPLFTEHRESWFGSRGWLVSLYGALAAGLLVLVLLGRWLFAGEEGSFEPPVHPHFRGGGGA